MERQPYVVTKRQVTRVKSSYTCVGFALGTYRLISLFDLSEWDENDVAGME